MIEVDAILTIFQGPVSISSQETPSFSSSILHLLSTQSQCVNRLNPLLTISRSSSLLFVLGLVPLFVFLPVSNVHPHNIHKSHIKRVVLQTYCSAYRPALQALRHFLDKEKHLLTGFSLPLDSISV